MKEPDPRKNRGRVADLPSEDLRVVAPKGKDEKHKPEASSVKERKVAQVFGSECPICFGLCSDLEHHILWHDQTGTNPPADNSNKAK